MHYTKYVFNMQKALPKQPHTHVPMQLENTKKRWPYLESKACSILAKDKRNKSRK